MFEKGKVILVPFPFTDLSSQKIRPALIVSKHQHVPDNVIVAFISSKIPKKTGRAHIVMKMTDHSFKTSGLKEESIIRCDKLATLDKKIVLGEIGKLNSDSMNKVTMALKSVLGL